MLPRQLVALALAALILAGCSREPSIEAMPFPGGAGSAQARLTVDADGAPVLSWLEPAGDAHLLRYARLSADGVGEIHDVVSSERMFINWADFPSVTPITDELWFAHWLRKRETGFAYDVATLISTDSGLSWTEAEQMNEDTTEAEHGFVSVFPWEERASAFWLDGRALANWSFDEPDALLGVSLRQARYDAAGRVVDRQIVDDLVCDCCQPDVAVSNAGPVVIYRDRTEDEIRDVKVRRYRDGAWSDPIEVGQEGWHFEACPVNGPVIAADDERVAAVWFTAANSRSRVRFTRSDDGGENFSEPVDIETLGALGQPGVVLDADGRAVVSWWRRSPESGIDLMLRSVDRNGEMSEPLLIAHETIGQAIDVPQLALRGKQGLLTRVFGKQYVLAWTTLEGDGSVRIALVDFG